jgi:hypothetical protein
MHDHSPPTPADYLDYTVERYSVIDEWSLIDHDAQDRARRYARRRYGRAPWKKTPPYPEFIELCARKAATRQIEPQDDGSYIVCDGWGQLLSQHPAN